MNGYELLALLLFVAALAGLVDYVRHDAFTARRTQTRDELGVAYRSRLFN